MASGSVLSIQNLTVSLGEKNILKDISVTIPNNAVSAILGPNGSGKSTLLKTITRFYAYHGQIDFFTTNLREMGVNQLRKKIAYISQTPVIFPGSVYENICWGRKYWGLPCDESIVLQFLKIVSLEAVDMSQPASELSGGQKQRLHIGRSLAIEPEVLLLDEPASALDAISKDNFESLIKELIEVNKTLTIVLITHDLHQTRRIADYVIVLDKGKKVLARQASEIFENSDNMSDVELLTSLLDQEEMN